MSAEIKQLPVSSQTGEVAIQSWGDLMQRAEFFAKSALIPQPLRNKPADVAIILQMGWELGIPPMQALNGIDVIQGRPAVKPELLIALIRSRLPNAYIKIESTEAEARVTMARDRNSLEEAYTATWNMQKAAKLNLASKDNYRTQPGTMLRWRAIMEAGRVIFPDMLKGLYSNDEIEGTSEAPVEDKGQKISETIAQAAAEVNRESIIEVKGLPIEPIEPEEPEAEPHPILDYVVPSNFKELAGKPLKEIPSVELMQYVAKLRGHFAVNKTKIRPEWNQFLKIAEEYLRICAAKEAGEDVPPISYDDITF